MYTFLCCVADWALPCKQIKDVFDGLAFEYRHALPVVRKVCAFKVVDVDTDEAEEYIHKLHIDSVPEVLLYKGENEVLDRVKGADPLGVSRLIHRMMRDIESELVRPPKTAFGYAPSEPTLTKASASSASTSTPTSTTAPHGSEQDGSGDIQDRLRKLTTKAPIMMFIKGTPEVPQCGFTKRLLGLWRDHYPDVGFETFNILADPEVRQQLKVFSDWPTYPQIYIGGEFVGGLDVFEEMVGNGEVEDLLKKASILGPSESISA